LLVAIRRQPKMINSVKGIRDPKIRVDPIDGSRDEKPKE
jgi:hypothetical protein